MFLNAAQILFLIIFRCLKLLRGAFSSSNSEVDCDIQLQVNVKTFDRIIQSLRYNLRPRTLFIIAPFILDQSSLAVRRWNRILM